MSRSYIKYNKEEALYGRGEQPGNSSRRSFQLRLSAGPVCWHCDGQSAVVPFGHLVDRAQREERERGTGHLLPFPRPLCLSELVACSLANCCDMQCMWYSLYSL